MILGYARVSTKDLLQYENVLGPIRRAPLLYKNCSRLRHHRRGGRRAVVRCGRECIV